MKSTNFMSYILFFVLIMLLFALARTFRFTAMQRGRKLHMMSVSGTQVSKQVVLEKGKARLFQDGNPLIYGGACKEVIGDPQAGDEVTVSDHMGNILGRGVFNPFSTYRIRMMARGYENVYKLSFRDMLKSRIQQAIAVRRSLALPSNKNTVYRLVNGEGDRLGGLIIDIMGSVVVAQSSAYWVERHRETIMSVLEESLSTCTKLVWRRADSRLKQDGYTGDMSDIIVSIGASKSLNPSDSQEDEIVIENNVKFVVCPENGQKTGFYCDQRDNRKMIRNLSEGKTVLDTFCYTAGFSVNAALGGALSVIAVDSSKPALDTAAKNIVNNGVQDIVTTVKADAIDFMRQLQSEGKQFDIVICDPPKLAPTRASLEKAKNK